MLSNELKCAIAAVKKAEAVIMANYQLDNRVILKSDNTPVTEIDIAAENAIKKVLLEQFSDYGFWGEETGKDNIDANNYWLIDPIDGTKSFIKQYGFFSTQVALVAENYFKIGVSNAPAFNELFYAEKGQGAYSNNNRLSVSDVKVLEKAVVSTGNIQSLANNHHQWLQLAQLLTQANRTRGYGDFYHYHLLAAGKIEVVIESDVNILDIAALTLIVQEAGGEVTEINGSPINLESTTIVATNGHLHQLIIDTLNG